jgi:hypothetical protein
VEQGTLQTNAADIFLLTQFKTAGTEAASFINYYYFPE